MQLKIFDLELVSPCNARCDFCPQSWQGVERAQPFLDPELLDRIVAEIGAMAREETVHAVLCGMGENLLRKSLVIRALDGLEAASRGRIRSGLVTNGSHLTLELLEHASFRRLDFIQVSISGYDPADYEAIYGLNHAQVVANVSAMAEALPGKVCLRTIDLAHLREGSAREDFVGFWRERGVEVTFRPLHSRGGHLSDPAAYPGVFRRFRGCEIFRFITFVSSDGKVLSCCHDVRSAHVVGDLRQATLAELIARKHQLQADAFPGYAICAGCTDFELASLGRSALAGRA